MSDLATNGGGVNGRGYLVVGAAGGIGTELCRALVASGAKVLLAGRDAGKLATLGAELGQPTMAMDASDFAQFDAAADKAITEFGRLDGIVNLAGSILLKAAHQTSAADLDTTLKLNLYSAFAAVRAAGRVMRSGGGSVVLMSSTAARVGLANHEAIAAAKGAVQGLMLAAAATYAGSIRVNCVAPGLVRTPMAKALLSSEMAEKASVAMHPAGRVGEAADVVPAIMWLLDGATTWVTGQIIGVDGGLSTVRPRVKM